MKMFGDKKARRSQILLQHLQPATTLQQATTTTNISAQSFISKQDTCGIVGFVSKEKDDDQANKYLMEGLFILQNRGYDSAGIATIDTDKSKLTISKYASLHTTSDALQRLKTGIGKHAGHNIGIAHTRWATHGAKTDTNAHPHTDRLDRIALVHNGVIENSNELREELHKKFNITCKSETDTEVIAQLIGHYLDQKKTLVEAIQASLERLEGTWGLVIISKVFYFYKFTLFRTTQNDSLPCVMAHHCSLVCLVVKCLLPVRLRHLPDIPRKWWHWKMEKLLF